MQAHIQTTDNQTAVITAIVQAGGRPMFVGGSVRDTISGKKQPKDIDIEVFGIAVDAIQAAIAMCEAVKDTKIAGVDFPVIKVSCVDGTDMDVSIPRREVKAGMGRCGFIVEADPCMPMQDAAERRDFTMNAIMADCVTGEVFDFFGGVADMHAGIIRAVGPRFSESPDRMIRAGRFAAQFGFMVGADVIAMSHTMADAGEFQTIKAEQIRAEFIKIAHAPHPSRAFRFFMDAGFGPFIPEVAAMVGCEQDARHHPEGDVFEHTMRVIDEMARICTDRGISGDDRVVMMMGAICHDMGKPETTIRNPDGSITSAGHAAAGVSHAVSFMARMGFNSPSMIDKVRKIVKHHMDHIGVEPSARIVRRMAQRFAPMTICEFVVMVEADASGRDKGRSQPAAAFEAIAIHEACSDQPQPAIIMGRHVIAAGVKAGPQVGAIVRACFEAQMDGHFGDIHGGMDFMHAMIAA